RLGGWLLENKDLSPETEARALDCLKRFGQRLKSLPHGSVRAVGTSALRQVRNSTRFLAEAEALLGHPIEIIAGREEARLVYLGVAHGLAAGNERRLVIDIGGGSTELIVGDGFQPRRTESIHMGCVNMTRWHFNEGAITAEAMRSAELSGALEMLPVKNEYRSAGWEIAVGASGTIRAINKVVQAAGWTDGQEGINFQSLEKLSNVLVDIGHVDKLQLDGLSDERKAVFPGGVAVLRSVFKALRIEQLKVSDKALREGLIYEMLGRTQYEDVRESTVRALCRRYDVDMEHASRVESTARSLFVEAAEAWQLNEGEYLEMLCWAIRLHEIGLTVSHSQFHKHGAYLIANSDMQGFSRQEQRVLSALIRGHRRKFPFDVFNDLPQDISLPALRLCILLRLSVLLHRARSATTTVEMKIKVSDNQIKLKFPDEWLTTHTLPRAELEQEAKQLSNRGFDLQFS
ncbi:MAG: Ppx/GppA family phosphatase, partial [Sedimenticola sp.]|nr:Ppx/GppA family phosphatase [Sedimenticola sp.]